MDSRMRKTKNSHQIVLMLLKMIFLLKSLAQARKQFLKNASSKRPIQLISSCSYSNKIKISLFAKRRKSLNHLYKKDNHQVLIFYLYPRKIILQYKILLAIYQLQQVNSITTVIALIWMEGNHKWQVLLIILLKVFLL